MGFRAGHGVIELGPNDGPFTSLVFLVEDNEIEITDVIVTYDKGERERIPARLIFRKGDHSHSLDLHGKGKHRIRSIAFSYRALGDGASTDTRVAVYDVRQISGRHGKLLDRDLKRTHDPGGDVEFDPALRGRVAHRLRHSALFRALPGHVFRQAAGPRVEPMGFALFTFLGLSFDHGSAEHHPLREQSRPGPLYPGIRAEVRVRYRSGRSPPP